MVALVVFLAPLKAGSLPGIWRGPQIARADKRVIRDRLDSRNTRDRQDYSFLNAVGAVWPADIANSAAGFRASTGFLIDPCHVLTSMHGVYTDDDVVNPPVGKIVAFAVGQTAGDGNKGALQGLRYLLNGLVVAYGGTLIVNHVVHNPENDWALIRLATKVSETIVPMTIATAILPPMPVHQRLSIAGFPADRRDQHGEQLSLKDLWGSDGELVRAAWTGTGGAVIESTVQATRGNSGGPLYGDFNGRQHVVVGIQQAIRGNGIDVSERAPNIQVFFTPDTLARIRAAQALTPCR